MPTIRKVQESSARVLAQFRLAISKPVTVILNEVKDLAGAEDFRSLRSFAGAQDDHLGMSGQFLAFNTDRE